jgi:hypothetical protein
MDAVGPDDPVFHVETLSREERQEWEEIRSQLEQCRLTGDELTFETKRRLLILEGATEEIADYWARFDLPLGAQRDAEPSENQWESCSTQPEDLRCAISHRPYFVAYEAFHEANAESLDSYSKRTAITDLVLQHLTDPEFGGPMHIAGKSYSSISDLVLHDISAVSHENAAEYLRKIRSRVYLTHLAKLRNVIVHGHHVPGASMVCAEKGHKRVERCEPVALHTRQSAGSQYFHAKR